MITGIILPEVIIKDALENIIRYIRTDLKNNPLDETQTILYKILGVTEEGKPIKMNRYNFFDQARKMFEKVGSLTVNFGYNLDVSQDISLHIILPAEQPVNPALGEDEGYGDELDDQGKVQQKFVQLFNSNYQIMITSSNSTEVNVIYNVLKAMFIAITPHLSLMGLLNPKVSGNDVVFQDDLIPPTIYHKALNLTFTYELIVPQLVVKEIVTGVIFEGTMKDYLGKA